MESKNTVTSKAFMFVDGAVSCLLLGFTLGRNTGEITPLSIQGASEIFGLSFTPAEKDSMIGALQSQRSRVESKGKK